MDVPVDAPLRRPTARARRALVWAQLALACLVVLAAAAVGGTVQDRIDDRDARLPDPSSAVLPEVASVPSGVSSALAGEARLARGPAGHLDGGHDASRQEGSLAALGTLLVGWTLTAAGGTVGRRRLEQLEGERWAAGWAGVEPQWSGRVP